MNRCTTILGSLVIAAWAVAGCSSAAAPMPTDPQPTASGVEGMTPADNPAPAAASTLASAEPRGLALQLPAFPDGGPIPVRYTCSGENASPALSWSGVPAESKSLALIVYDADAGVDLGAGTELGFIHWLIYDLPATSLGLPAEATGDTQALAGGLESPNDFHTSAGAAFPGGAVVRGAGYDGPCPPEEHTYVFRLLALDDLLGLPAGTSPQLVLGALEGHVLAESDWTGTYAPAQ
jgi:hypothetical protein